MTSLSLSLPRRPISFVCQHESSDRDRDVPSSFSRFSPRANLRDSSKQVAASRPTSPRRSGLFGGESGGSWNDNPQHPRIDPFSNASSRAGNLDASLHFTARISRDSLLIAGPVVYDLNRAIPNDRPQTISLSLSWLPAAFMRPAHVAL
jgi:hypothetical protein